MKQLSPLKTEAKELQTEDRQIDKGAQLFIRNLSVILAFLTVCFIVLFKRKNENISFLCREIMSSLAFLTFAPK